MLDMKTLILKRIASDESTGTQGVLIDEIRGSEPMRIIRIPFAVTLEPPWHNNQKDISCIPPGAYIIKRTDSPKFGDTYEVLNVNARENILLHSGSFVKDTQGCIIVAEKFSFADGKFMVQESKLKPDSGFNEFMMRLTALHLAKLIIEKCYVE